MQENLSILAIQSVYDESMPRPCKEVVRGEILPSAWILEPDTLDGKDITRVIYMTQVRGSVQVFALIQLQLCLDLNNHTTDTLGNK